MNKKQWLYILLTVALLIFFGIKTDKIIASWWRSFPDTPSIVMLGIVLLSILVIGVFYIYTVWKKKQARKFGFWASVGFVLGFIFMQINFILQGVLLGHISPEGPAQASVFGVFLDPWNYSFAGILGSVGLIIDVGVWITFKYRN